MRILLSPGTFKGSLSAEEAADAMAEGVSRCGAGFESLKKPVADGGEGTSAALVRAIPGSREELTTVMGPMGSPESAPWALLGPDYQTAALDMASAAGLLLVPEADRNPMRATTYGVGQLIQAAVGQPGVKHIIIGLGGSATNDGGAGCLQGLGYVFLDERGEALAAPISPDQLGRVRDVLDTNVRDSSRAVSITIACDVDNPLTGPRGASAVFGPQKGASPAMVRDLDLLLNHFGAELDRFARRRSLIGEDWIAIPERAGAGAAGGLGSALMTAFPNAVIRPGIDVVLDQNGFDDALECVDLVVTGEGRLDAQTLGGKAILGVVKRAVQRGIPVAIIAGAADHDAVEMMKALGVRQVVTLESLALSTAEAMRNAPIWIARAMETILTR